MAGARIIVVGGGTMGLAAAWRLAERGASVEVFERHGVVHEHGSHGGFTRAIRHAYHEGADYVPLVREADAAWVALGEASGRSILVRSGLVEVGAPDDPGFASAIEACRIHGIPHTRCSAAEAQESVRWPFALPAGWEACYTASGGYLLVRNALEAMASAARDAGARIHTGVPVEGIDPDPDRPAVRVAGERREADHVVITAGVELPDLLAKLGVDVVRKRRVLLWLRPPAPEAFAGLPVWGAFVPGAFFYGFPYLEEGIRGVKVACHAGVEPDDPIDPGRLDRTLRPTDLAPLERFVERYLPSLGFEVEDHAVCMYTCTTSEDFLIDRLPGASKVLVAGGFSGHGFKFAPAIGRLVADLVLDNAAPREDFGFEAHRAS